MRIYVGPQSEPGSEDVTRRDKTMSHIPPRGPKPDHSNHKSKILSKWGQLVWIADKEVTQLSNTNSLWQ